MKTITQLFVAVKATPGTVVFSPALSDLNKSPIATNVYISKRSLPPGVRQIKLTMSLPESDNDQAFNALPVQ